jgi:hypothetical protein
MTYFYPVFEVRAKDGTQLYRAVDYQIAMEECGKNIGSKVALEPRQRAAESKMAPDALAWAQARYAEYGSFVSEDDFADFDAPAVERGPSPPDPYDRLLPPLAS